MKRVNTQWTTAFAAAALLGLPAASWSQSPAAQQPTASGAHAEHGSAQEHVRQAKMALNDIPAASVPARAKARLAELKRHVNALEKSAGGGGATGTTGTTGAKTAARGKANWATEVAAIDKILTELLGSSATGSTAAGAQSTTGAAGTTGSAGSATASAALDETTRSKLMEVRTHITAFAGSMSGTGPASPGSADASGAASASTNAAAAQMATQPSAASATGAQPQASAQAGDAGTSSSASTTGAQGAQATEQRQGTPEASPAAQSQPTTGAQADPDATARHLTAARDALSQLTQLPAASQLQGEARTQVSQLISNFNELITTKTEWRASYDKVAANVTALLGAESVEGPAAQAAPQTGTAGAVGTSGAASATIDPAIRAKLMEFRNHLMEFEKASGAASPSATPNTSSTSGTSTAGTAPSAGSSPAAASSTATGNTSGTTSSTDAAASSTTSPAPPAAAGNQDAVRHIEAIEAILSGRSGAAGSSSSGAAGSTGSAAGGVTLDRAQIEQIRTHLSQLRKAVENK